MSIKNLTWKFFNIGLIFTATLIATVSFFAFDQFGPEMDIDVLKGISVIGLSAISILSTRLFLNASIKVFQITVSLCAYFVCLMILSVITDGIFGIQISTAEALFLSTDSIVQVVIGFIIILLMAGLRKKVKVSSAQRQNIPGKQNNLFGKLNPKAFLFRIKDALNNFGGEVKKIVVKPFIFIDDQFNKLRNEIKKLTKKCTGQNAEKRKKVVYSKKPNTARQSPKTSVKNKPSTQMKSAKSLKAKAVAGKKDVSISKGQIKKKKVAINSKPKPIQTRQKISVQQNKAATKTSVSTRKPTQSRNNHKSVLRFLGLQQSKVQLSKEVENRCPFCLELVEENDPRGVVTCPVCHTQHHADCWAVTGTCQVPHKHV